MKDKLLFWIKTLALVGVVLATYLLWEQIHKSPVPFCTINSTVNCDAIISGAVSKTLGIPTPLIGLIGYTSILIGAFKKNSKLILGMATFGLIFCLYIGFRETFELRVTCPVCIACLLDMATVFVLSVLLNRKNSESLQK